MFSPALDAVRRLFASGGLCRAVESIKPLAGGEISQVYEVRCTEPDRALVLKVYPDDYRWKMAKEAFVFGLLEPSSALPTPRVLVADDSGALLPQACLITTMLPGTLAASEMESLSDGDVVHVYRQIGAILRAFHAVTFDAFGYLSTQIVDPHSTNAGYMEYQFDKKLREFAEHGGDPDIRRAAERSVASSAYLFAECSRAALCHDDLHEGNLLLSEREGEWRVSGVLDVENAVAGDPLLDLAKTDYYSVRGDPAKRRGLLEGYGPLPPSGEETLSLYRLYHALELWDWFASMGNEEPLTRIGEDIRSFSG